MVDLQGQIVPEDEAELDLMMAVYEVTGQARQNGVATGDIVATLTFAAASIQALDDDVAVAEAIPDDGDVPREDCPACGEEIEDVLWSIGGEGSVQPCGCEVLADDLPGWIDYE